MNLLDIFTFSGRLHPLIVHLPIGFILLAVLFNLLSYNQKYSDLKQAVPVTLLVGFIAAAMACVFGYLLSLSGDYDTAILTRHKFSGISLSVITGLLYLLSTGVLKRYAHLPGKLFSGFLVALVILMSYSGHQGGNLTHGNDYLTLKTLLQERRAKPATAEQALLFEDVVQPILEKKCVQCHRDGKMKGDLSLENLPAILKGGKAGPAVVAGRINESELFKRIMLDEGHKDFMPADGKPPLTNNEVQIIKWWIKEGAAAGRTVASFDHHEALKPMIAVYLGLGGAAARFNNQSDIAEVINPDIPLTADTASINALRKKGLHIRMMLNKPMMLDVTMPAKSGISIAEIKPDLLKVAKHIVWLNLSSNGLSDNDLGFLSSLINLEKLRLDKNPVTDELAGSLIALKHLEAVNLNETKITGASVTILKRNPAIRSVYTWGTAAFNRIIH